MLLVSSRRTFSAPTVVDSSASSWNDSPLTVLNVSFIRFAGSANKNETSLYSISYSVAILIAGSRLVAVKKIYIVKCRGDC